MAAECDEVFLGDQACENVINIQCFRGFLFFYYQGWYDGLLYLYLQLLEPSVLVLILEYYSSDTVTGVWNSVIS